MAYYTGTYSGFLNNNTALYGTTAVILKCVPSGRRQVYSVTCPTGLKVKPDDCLIASGPFFCGVIPTPSPTAFPTVGSGKEYELLIGIIFLTHNSFFTITSSK